MKNKLIVLSLAITAQFSAQQSFKLYAKSTGTVISANQLFQQTTVEADVTKFTIDIQNTTLSSTFKYLVKRYDILLNAQAVANFCFAGGCYDASKTVSPDSLTLLPGQKASELDVNIPNSTLDCDILENGPIGKSIVKYTIFNANNKNDSMMVTFSYNGAIVGINTINKNVASMSLFPNPAKENTTLKINSLKTTDIQISVYNMLGEVIESEKSSLTAGENEVKLNTKDYPKGVYFVTVPDGSNSVITKKLVIN